MHLSQHQKLKVPMNKHNKDIQDLYTEAINIVDRNSRRFSYMGGDTVLMDRKLEVVKIIIVPKLTYEVKCNSILIPI